MYRCWHVQKTLGKLSDVKKAEQGNGEWISENRENGVKNIVHRRHRLVFVFILSITASPPSPPQSLLSPLSSGNTEAFQSFAKFRGPIGLTTEVCRLHRVGSITYIIKNSILQRLPLHVKLTINESRYHRRMIVF